MQNEGGGSEGQMVNEDERYGAFEGAKIQCYGDRNVCVI